MAIKKFKQINQDPVLAKAQKAEHGFATFAHVNAVIEEVNTISLTPGLTGAQGVQGPVGPQGDLGPVGPAGLEWQGLWDADTAYAADDAVGYNGASWFCINPISTTGNDNPEADTVTWALLAAQGAQGQPGATGAQGPQGIQGPVGPSGSPSSLVSQQVNVSTGTNPEINSIGFVRLYATANYQSCKLTGPHPIGKEIYIKNTSNYIVVVNGVSDNINGSSSINLPPNTYWHIIKEDGGTNSITAFEIYKPKYTSYKAFITQTGTDDPVIDTISENTTGKIFTTTRLDVGKYEITPNSYFLEFKKVFVNLELADGLKNIVVSNQKIEVKTFDITGAPFDFIDSSRLSIDIY